MYRVLIVFYILYFIFSPARAQDSLLLRNYEVVKQQNAWLTGRNAAALTRFSSRDIATAEAALSWERGGLANYTDGQRLLTADVCAEAFCRLSPRVVAAGGISYQNWSGKDMTGSAFINPDRMPFNLVEDSLTNAGNKHRDTYRLSGGVGVDLWRGIAIGARLDYTSANYAKYKDLRHKNKLMDLQLTAGILFTFNGQRSMVNGQRSMVNVGLDYTYHRQTESVSFGTYGKNEKVYKTLIDYGAMMGRAEQFGNEGFTDKNREMPFFEDAHGGGIQLELCPFANTHHPSPITLYAAVEMSHGTGYYGRRSPYTITYTNHDRDITDVTVQARYVATESQHTLSFDFRREKVENRMETFRELTNPNGATYYEYFDAVESGDKWWRDVQVAWTSRLGMHGETPTWQLHAAYLWGKRTQRAYLYPFFRRQHLNTNEVNLSVARNLIGQCGIWTLTVEGGYHKGSGTPADDYAFVEPDSKQEAPATMEAHLMREYHYLTAPQYRLGASVQYAFVFPGTQLKTHARLSASYRKANETCEYNTASDRTRLSLAVGCTF